MEKRLEHLYEKLDHYADSDYYPYHMPGHKRRMAGDMPKQILRMDITEITGFDNLHDPEGILQELQEKAAVLYGAEESFYLVNGSTGGILSAISAALPAGGRILMARNCHRSAYHAAYLRNLTVSYLYPPVLEEYDINDAVTPGQIEEALKKEPGVGAVMIVSPTYEGRIADVEQIAQVVHKRGIPLIVDEAHGAHLGWTEDFCQNSCQAGADLVIHSVHKTLPAMTQTALLHVNGKLIDRDRLRRFLHIYQSSSPSYVLMASIDNAMQMLEKDRNTLFARFSRQYRQMLDGLSACRCLQFPPLDEKKQDMGKLVISSKKSGLSGQRIYDILLEKYHLQLEMAAGSYCLAMFTVSDGREAYERMTKALLELDGQIARGILKPDPVRGDTQSAEKPAPKADGNGAGPYREPSLGTDPGNPCAALPLGKAWETAWEMVPLREAVGRYAGDFVNLYPPGIPLLVPGEILTKEKYCQITAYLEQHLNVQGVEKTGDIQRVKVLRGEPH